MKELNEVELESVAGGAVVGGAIIALALTGVGFLLAAGYSDGRGDKYR